MASALFERAHEEQVLGTLTCVDRLIVHGHLRLFWAPGALLRFLETQGLRISGFGDCVAAATARIKAHVKQIAEAAKAPIIHLDTSHRRFAPGDFPHSRRRPEARRIKHYLAGNWLKMYDKWSVLRVETVINRPYQFRVPRSVVDGRGRTRVRWGRMGKGIFNLWRYIEVGEQANRRYLDALAQVQAKSRDPTFRPTGAGSIAGLFFSRGCLSRNAPPLSLRASAAGALRHARARHARPIAVSSRAAPGRGRCARLGARASSRQRRRRARRAPRRPRR
jgi:hypothetical protein